MYTALYVTSTAAMARCTQEATMRRRTLALGFDVRYAVSSGLY